MTDYKGNRFNERLNTAASAKREALEKYRAKAGPADPAFVERQAARLAVSLARDARLAERKLAREADRAAREAAEAVRQAEAARQAAEQAAQDIILKAEQAARDAALEIERKAARDARYAARKARSGPPGRGAGRGR